MTKSPDVPAAQSGPRAETHTPDAADPSQYNQSLAKGLGVLEYLATHNGSAKLGSVAEDLEMDKATAKRFLNTLAGLGYIRLSPEGKRYSVTLKTLQIGYSATAHLGWREIAGFYLEQLFEEAHETTSLCVLDNRDIVYLARITKSGAQADTGPGSRRPAYASSMGKMLLAMQPEDAVLELIRQMTFRPVTPYTVPSEAALLEQLATARERGYAVCDREASELVRSIAAPVFNNGRAFAAVGIAVEAARYTREDMERVLGPKVVSCAAQISTALRQIEYRGPL
jgi:Transcriptional regulator